jgi:hypothetical protein
MPIPLNYQSAPEGAAGRSRNVLLLGWVSLFNDVAAEERGSGLGQAYLR